MAGGSTTSKDKFIVSFNSDTSDSEDDDDTTPAVKKPPPPAASKAPVMNGHVETKLQNGDVDKSSSSSSAKTDLDNFGLGEGYGKKTKGEGLSALSTRSDKFGDLGASSRPSSGYGSRESGKSSDTSDQDLDSAYTRAKERNSRLAAKKQETPSLLIDLSDSDNFAPVKPASKMDPPKRQNSYSADLEDISGFYDSKSTSDAPMANGHQTLDFGSMDVKKGNSADLGFDADLLIYASSGTPTKFNFDQEPKVEAEPKRPKNVDDDFMNDKTFRRQTSKPDEKEALLSPKDKYIEDKFSAICNKYGSKRERPSTATKKADNPPEVVEVDGDLYGAVRVKTGPREIPKPQTEDEDQGFSEEKAKPKLTFDDIISWKKGSTDDLIQRILSDARNESANASKARPEPRQEEYTPRTETRQLKITPYERDMGGEHRYDYGASQPSLLERRIASLSGSAKKPEEQDSYSYKRQPEPEPYSYKRQQEPEPYSYQRQQELEPYVYKRQSQREEEDDQFYKRKARGSSAIRELDDADAMSLSENSAVTRYVPWKERQKQRYQDDEDDIAFGASAVNYQPHRLRVPSRYDDSESDDESYKSSRPREPVLPDEFFMPQRSDETDTIVTERTAEVRNMVDNQNEVLGRLKKASKEFDDLDAEIRALKQECIENQVARQTAIEDIMEDMKRPGTYDDEEPVPTPNRYTRGAYVSRDTYTPKYTSSSYTPSYSRGRYDSSSKLDSDLDSSRLGGYALGSVARSKWGEPGGSRAFRSASVSRFDNFEEEGKSYDKYGLYTPKRSLRAGSCVDDSDTRSNHSYHPDDESECASVRSYEKGGDDDESGYRSRYGSSKYGSSLAVPSTTRAYSVSRESRSPSRRSVSRDYSTPTSSYSSYDRPRSRGMSLPPPDKPFQSRFLSKVREKKASGVDINKSRDKPFKSRFLTRSFDSDYGSGSSSRGSLASTPDKNTYSSSSTKSYRSRDKDSGDSARATGAAD